jgi:hypothetical protein
MNLNSDFGARAAVHAARLDWTPSPIPGVGRRMLDRIGDEGGARHLDRPLHPALPFRAAHPRRRRGVPGAGRRLPGRARRLSRRHLCPQPADQQPHARLKLWQFDPDDRTPVRTDTTALSFAPAPAIPGVEFAVLYENAEELVLLERWAPGVRIAVPIPGGIELLVLDGGFTEGREEFTRYSWLRLPTGSTLQARAGPQGCRLWVKSGHLTREP